MARVPGETLEEDMDEVTLDLGEIADAPADDDDESTFALGSDILTPSGAKPSPPSPDLESVLLAYLLDLDDPPA